ncbi:MAG: hypothetical protein HYU78_16675 [Rhodocyclales bacterium]|nr:hypothetical protein [Rhodocyclales bacterium]
MEDEPIESPGVAPVRWVTVDAAEPGMVLARPVVVARQGVLLLTLAAGAALTADMLAQLIARGVECVGIEDDLPADSAEAQRRRQLRHQLRHQRLEAIFGDARENLDAERRTLFDALLAGST